MTCFDHSYNIPKPGTATPLVYSSVVKCSLCDLDGGARPGKVMVLGSCVTGAAAIISGPVSPGLSEERIARLRRLIGPDVSLMFEMPCCCLKRAERRAENARRFLARRKFVIAPEGPIVPDFPLHPRIEEQLRYAVEGAV